MGSGVRFEVQSIYARYGVHNSTPPPGTLLAAPVRTPPDAAVHGLPGTNRYSSPLTRIA
jgi:hypothetical protein